MTTTESMAVNLVAAVCPVAPEGAQQHVDQIAGYVLWGVIAIMGVALFVGIGAVAGGRLFSMPHASKVGVISVVVILISGMALLIVPGILNAIIGSGCVS